MYQRFKNKHTYKKTFDGHWAFIQGMEELLFSFVVLGLVNSVPPSFLLYIAYTVLAIASLPVLRWLVDVARNLRIKKDTGDSAKLQEMQAEIDNLKQKIK